MQLNKKKELAARTLHVGKDRIVFNKERLSDIKEAITKQDIKDLHEDKAIMIKDIRGSRTKEKRKTRRRVGSIKKKVKTRKREYMTITRKLRAYLAGLKEREVITNEEFRTLRKEIRARDFRSRAHLKDRVQQLIKEREE